MASELERVPIIHFWDLMLVPLQGELGDDLAERVNDQVLNRIYADRVKGLVIDVTALWMMDSHLCAIISRLAQAAGLMGARTFLCGMSPEIAMTLQTMGLDLGNVETTLTLQGALEELGVTPPARDDAPEAWSAIDAWSDDQDDVSAGGHPQG